MKLLLAALALLALAALLAAPLLWPRPRATPRAELELGALLGGEPDAGFARALAPRDFRFPADHGPHPEFQSEWWYVTGNLEGARGRRFGYQLTLFRRALAPGVPQRESAWATHQLWMGHLALSDAQAGRFRAFERFARGALGLAGARAAPLRVWVEGWSLASEGAGTFPLRLTAAEDEVALDLMLEPEKELVLQGDAGLSRKGREPGNASYYYSFTRLATRGTLRAGGGTLQVRGLSWLDREWSTSALEADQVGWDWLALQLDDGRELMLYQLREEGGGVSPTSSGTLVHAGGDALPLSAAGFALEVLDTWTSPASGATYPAAWRVLVPSADLALELRPLLADQELRLSVRYWEGAVDVLGPAGAPVGRGYVELTGY